MEDPVDEDPRNAFSAHGFRVVEQRQGKPKYSGIVLCHFVFKVVAFLVYELCGLMGMSFVTSFIVILFLLSIDFWVVKNLSGRLLAGLRWWNIVEEGTGKSVWHFEAWSAEERLIAQSTQVKLFWLCLFAQQSLWTLILIVTFFTLNFKWAIVCTVSLAMNTANLYGYLRCRMKNKDNNQTSMGQKIQDYLSYYFRRRYDKGTLS